MTAAELTSYRNEICQKYKGIKKLQILNDVSLLNAEDTDNRVAYKGISWIDYWRSLTKRYTTILHCSCCGKEIIIGTPTPEQVLEWTTLDETIDEHKAEGGHVEFSAPKEADWKGGLFIVPLCPKCNAQRGKYITIKEGSYLCKEVGANVTEE